MDKPPSVTEIGGSQGLSDCSLQRYHPHREQKPRSVGGLDGPPSYSASYGELRPLSLVEYFGDAPSYTEFYGGHSPPSGVGFNGKPPSVGVIGHRWYDSVQTDAGTLYTGISSGDNSFGRVSLPYGDQIRSIDQSDLNDDELKKHSCCEDLDESFLHPSHDHILKLTHVLQNNSQSFGRSCSGCLEKLTISADPHYFYCSQCDYSLHKLCATLPPTKKHRLDEKHDLQLVYEPPHDYGIGTCTCCGDGWSNFTYSCLECKIEIDVKCATVGERTTKHWLHQHRLTLVSEHIYAKCYFCGNFEEGSFFHCTICEKPNSWISSHCAQYPRTLPFLHLSDQAHEHPLVFANRSKKQCDICQKDITKGSPRYKCPKEQCKYDVHVRCAIPAPAITKEVLYVRYEENTTIVPHLPFPDNSYSLVKHSFSKQAINEPSLNPFIHEHPLYLFNKTKLEENLVSSAASLLRRLNKLMKKFQLTCKLCGQLIIEAPFYRCPEEGCVNFLLHTWCACLPTELHDQPCHPNHSLILQPKYSQLFGFLGLFKCDVCGLWCDGFSFGCDECDYHIDVNCALLPGLIKHEAHPKHPLRLSKVIKPKLNKLSACVACSTPLDHGAFVYQCFICKFIIHSECSLAPREIRHRYVKDFYRLMYSPPHSEKEYFCDICEEPIEKKQWFYDCDQQDMSVHAAFGICLKPYNKVLRLIRIGSHPHGFALFATDRKTKCSVCKKPVSSLPFFKCTTDTCGISVDCWCVPEMIRASLGR